MKIATYLVLLLSIFSLNAQDEWNDAQAVLIDTARAMRAYGFSDGTFNAQASIVEKLKSGVVEKVGAFENAPVIDTKEEFLTAAFYSKLEPEKPEMKAVISQELSTGSSGARKIGAMWLKKRVDRGKTYNDVISYISTSSNLTEEQLLAYYREAISAEIDSIVASVMKDIPRKYYSYFRDGDPENTSSENNVNAIDLIKEYYIQPSEGNYKNLVSAVRYFGKKGTESQRGLVRFRAFVSILEELSPHLKEQITKDIFKDEDD